MKSNYKLLGKYIREVKNRNTDGSVTNLLGVNIDKYFMPSVANVVGTDMTKYKVVRNGQFACNRMHVGRDKRLPVALSTFEEPFLVSPAYDVFEIEDETQLDPEYLMMWFSRKEFDRNAWFYTDADVRGGLNWSAFCEMKLPVPSIEKQKEIVAEYNTIVNRIKLNEELNRKLEETAQAIYKRWFVDFEFPVSREYAEEMGRPELEGKPYRSSGGEMVWCGELEKEIPKGWGVISVKEFCADMKSGGTPNRNNPEYWNSKDLPWLKTGEIKNNIIIKTEEFISKRGLKESSAKLLPNGTVLMSMYGVNAGDIGMLKIESSTNQACCGMVCKNEDEAAFLYYQLLHKQAYHSSQSIGGAQENLSKDYIKKIILTLPSVSLISACNLKILVNKRETISKEDAALNFVLQLLLSKMTVMDRL